ncbi:restriction endonuclease subunit S [Veillonellaceae bacterium M1-70]|jgi:type I restriction-modification system specificity subunit|uniref:restriction endonuclease subunit S n=1 Tax=uncultured Megasphaera sp. TaxID=165188 RepID=UPI0012E1508A|nr:restriction endonuclease subunit S [uncultured Megasphaera sp.]MUP49893.1 restriction endonuclease subunit S [Veillonellaceae bacterium M1-70]
MSWDYVTLDKLGSISRGKSKHRPRNDKTLFGGKYPFIQTADVKAAGLYLTDYNETYNDKGLAQSKLWSAGTLCITIAANIADTAILGIDACFPDSVMGFTPYEDISNVKFVKYAFDILQRDCKKISQGTAQDNLSWKKLSTIKFPAPDIEIQDKIVSKLSVYDDLIENNRKQIKLLEEAARRLYKEWFVDLHFPGYEDVKIVDGLPEGWEKCSIMDNDVFIFAKSKITPFEGLKLYYATADVTGTEISGDGVWVTFQNKPSRAAIKPINDSVWFARMSNSYKILCCYGNSSHLSETTIISSGFAGFTAREGCFGFVFATIASKWFDKEKNRYATGATQVSLTNEGLKKIQVVLPTKNVAEEYSRIVEPYIEKAEQLKRSIKLLSQARDRLLPKLMSGEIEV